ncbi:Vacuolar sorting protein 9 subgroup [Penicillium bovifimosum]|uniref:Vacuolar sorting protein 9 subgroup n=1 Tax=Penicillium bovifimosum TaxID=126998 RepID=A0A9W9HDX2_9EURO|nr:Vacuolar sorting protein 9 subgroup [Penicillium bovifimosum]KAJ5143768.1 Vacuolar sorting protein 9 subgroup [Penicillium bovifimosum]
MEGSDAKNSPTEGGSQTIPLASTASCEEPENGPDVFERRDSAESQVDAHTDEGFVLSRSLQDPSEELPIELISLADRFVNSLSAKVHSSPPSIERISELFQVFYSRAESHIATHISALITRINRDVAPQTPAKAPRGSALSKLSSKRSQDDVRSGASGRQMLTASEVAEKRKARKSLEIKRIALEEAAERRVCELVYDKLWRHKTTLDDVRDEKLRSKTAALLLVGINLKDLGIDIDFEAIEQQKQDEANEYLAQAREYLAKMNDYKYPLGKLQQLAAAHKAIVDALTKLLPSSSSADEILPTLIYSLVTCPPEGINIVSNLVFIQRFRSSSKIDGETAYCLTNLEAAISFLENVDLSTLRADELQDGPVKTPSETTPSSERIDPFRPSKETTTSSVTAVSASPELSIPESKEPLTTLPTPRPSATPQQRRLSNIFQPPSKVLGAANDAVRTTADQSLKNISATLDSSFNFLFGRLREMQNIQGSGQEGSGPVLPKTLAEARRLMTLPSPSATNQPLTQEDIAAINSVSVDESTPPRSSSGPTDLSSNGPTTRDRSVDSTRTQGSDKKSIATSLREEISSHPAVSPTTPLESMRYFGNTLNPLNHIPGMMKSFGRNTPETPSGRSVSPSGFDRFKSSPISADGATSAAATPSSRIDPPIQRFLETQDVHDLRIGDVAVLLEDYKRLAAAMQKYL